MNNQMTVSQVFQYAKKMNISFNQAIAKFNKCYTPTLNGWIDKPKKA